MYDFTWTEKISYTSAASAASDIYYVCPFGSPLSLLMHLFKIVGTIIYILQSNGLNSENVTLVLENSQENGRQDLPAKKNSFKQKVKTMMQ